MPTPFSKSKRRRPISKEEREAIQWLESQKIHSSYPGLKEKYDDTIKNIKLGKHS